MPRKPTVKMTARLKVKGTLFSLVESGTQCSSFQVVLVEVSKAVHLNVCSCNHGLGRQHNPLNTMNTTSWKGQMGLIFRPTNNLANYQYQLEL